MIAATPANVAFSIGVTRAIAVEEAKQDPAIADPSDQPQAPPIEPRSI